MDYRASAGYGREWRTAIYRHMGKPEVEDMRDGVNWLIENANVDAKRVGTYGGSYGGFLTLMSMFTDPDLFASGSAIRLVSDWAYYNHGYTSNILNTPEDDAIAYERSSPIYFAEGLNKPLLINAPMVDDNVFFEDTVRLVQRLIELEKQDFETAIYPVEPHGFVQPSSWLNEYRRIYKLFENTL
jgi:dipeptidyl aminopeptidase/acylaminoacyl peptidase